MTQTWQERIWKLIEKRSDGCWIWKGFCSSVGTPMYCIYVGSGSKSVRKLLYQLEKNTTPKGKLISACGTSKCVNPRHIKANFSMDEWLDDIRKFSKGAGPKNTKIMIEIIRTLRQALLSLGNDSHDAQVAQSLVDVEKIYQAGR